MESVVVHAERRKCGIQNGQRKRITRLESNISSEARENVVVQRLGDNAMMRAMPRHQMLEHSDRIPPLDIRTAKAGWIFE